jgi:Ca-activated chloride channel family protein
VTAIYEVTPKGSSAAMVDDLRYRRPSAATDAGGNEYAFVKIRYKLPDGETSKLVSTPVTPADEVDGFSKASDDVRFSVAVAAFGQKLRQETETTSFGYDRITRIAAAARGADPYGYRAEFLSLVRLASALDAGKR